MVESRFPRLHVVTNSLPIVDAVLSVAAPGQVAIQVRVLDHVTDREAYALAVAAVGKCRAGGARGSRDRRALPTWRLHRMAGT